MSMGGPFCRRQGRSMLPLTCVALLAVFLVPGLARAQLSISCRMKHTRVLQFERMAMEISCRNDTGRTLTLGGKDSDVALYLEFLQTPDYPVAPKGSFLLDAPVELIPHKVTRVEVNLRDYFFVQETGPFSARAKLVWGDYKYTAKKAYLDIVPGLEIASAMARTLDGTAVRHFSLRTLHRDMGNHLFLRIDDQAEDLCLAVHELGRFMRDVTPQLQADASSNVHILHLSGPGVFTHTVVSAEGVPQDQTLHESQGSASLVDAPGGQLVVKVSRPPADRIRQPTTDAR